MKGFSLTLFCCLFLVQSLFAVGAYNRVDWLRNYEEAAQRSQRESKPLVILFTGSDWCSWCTKLEKEALDTPEFAQVAGSKFIFLVLDFPVYKTQEPQLTQQNKDLQKKFDVKGFPTIVMLDPKQRKIGTTGYRSGGGKLFAEHLIKMADGFNGYQQRAAQLEDNSFRGQELKCLYEKASEYKFNNDQEKIVKQGVDSDFSHYFLTEQYRLLVSQGHIDDSKAVALRQQLLSQDSANRFSTHYKIALIDFEAYNDAYEEGKISYNKAIEPLVAYITAFQNQDSDNIWRLELLVSQICFCNNDLKLALKYATMAQANAPPSAKPDISLAIKNIQSKISDTASYSHNSSR